MNNFIIRDSASDIRGMSRFILRKQWVTVALGVLIFQLVMTLVPDILTTLFPLQTNYNEQIDQVVQTSSVSALYNLLMTGPLTFGLNMFFLSFLRYKDVNYGNLFEGFSFYLKALALNIVMNVFIFLWALLLLIPGIIAYYRYSQAYYILVDDPTKGIMQCINESKAMMVGNKSHLFGVQMSFIGWYFLAVLPSSIIIQGMGEINDITSTIVSDILLIIPMSLVMAYSYTAFTIFYELLKFGKRENLPYDGERELKPNVDPSNQLTETENRD
ncbi:MAG: DUF975 family protein [Clostridiales bacterium]|nr:DUF975 family protein [Clostridiales bacterium]